MYALLREIGIFSRNSLLPLNCVLRLYYCMRNLSETDVPICHWLMSSQSDSQHVPLLCGNLDYCAVCANGVYMYRSIQCTPRRTRVLFSHHSLTSTNSNYSRRSPKTRLLRTYIRTYNTGQLLKTWYSVLYYICISWTLRKKRFEVENVHVIWRASTVGCTTYIVCGQHDIICRFLYEVQCGYQVLTYWWCVHLKYPTVVHVCVCPLWFKHALELTETVNPGIWC